MPPAVPLVAAAAGYAATAGIATAIGATLGTFTAGAIASSLAGFVVSTAIDAIGSRMFAPKPKRPDFSQNAVSQAIMVRSSVESHKVIYGRSRVSGPIVFIGTTSSGPDANRKTVTGTNKFVHIVIALAGHEVDSIGDVYFNDKPVSVDSDGWVTTSPYPYSPSTLSRTIATAVRSGNVLTVTTTVAHGFSADDSVSISGVSDGTMDGDFVIIATPTATTFTVSNGGSDASATGGKATDLTGRGTTTTSTTAAIATVARSSGIVTITTVHAHGFSVGDRVTIDTTDTSINGTFAIASTPTSTSFTYTKAGRNMTPREITGSASATVSVTTTVMPSYARIRKFTGATDQVASADLIAEVPGWDSSHRLRGIAYLYVRLEYNQNIFNQGIPNISAVVQGKKLYDPRTGTTAWSDNVALAVRDYMTSDYGFNCDDDEINDTYFSAAANICDEEVTLASGGSQARYTCNGVIDTANAPLDNLNAMVAAMAGTVTYVQGQFRAHAGAYDATVANLDTSMLAEDPHYDLRPPRQQVFNAVKGTYTDPSMNWQPTDFAPVTNATYQADDGGQQIFRDIQLPFTNDAEAAQRIAKVLLEQGRQGIQIELPLNHRVLNLAVWDTVTYTDPVMGWDHKVFRIKKLSTPGIGPITLSLQEESAASYDWNSGEATTVDTAPDTNLPDPFTVQASGALTVTESTYVTRGGTEVKAKATMTWVASEDAFLYQYQPEYQVKGQSSWLVLARTEGTTAEVLDIQPGTYNFRVKVVNTIGQSSDYVTASKQIAGLAAVPSAPQNLTIATIGGLAILRWDQSSDNDVRIGGKIVFRHSPDTAANWGQTTSIGNALPGSSTVAILPLKPGVYRAKFVDSSGIESATSASVTTEQATALAYANVTSLTEHPTFSGTKTDCFVDGTPTLTISGAGTFDDITDLDSVESVDGFGGIASSATYLFSGGIDLTTVQPVRITSHVLAEVVNERDTVDDRTDDIDDWVDFDGADAAEGDAVVYVRSTNDDPAGTPTWSAWNRLDSGEFNARAFEFKLTLTSHDPAYNVHVSELSVTIDQVA